MSVLILGIESSCDDTSAAVIEDGRLLSNVIGNQQVHREYGGVVPELASRAHQANIIPTQLVVVRNYLDMEIIGKTIDDAAGEAFDKCAKLMGLDYPGGPIVDKLARDGDPNAFRFAKPLPKGLDFSFSGLKTSFLYFLRDNLRQDEKFIESRKADLCASLQQTIVDILVQKLIRASKLMGIKNIALAGGVAANSALREAVVAVGKNRGWTVFLPELRFTTDNAAMIAIVGYYKFLEGDFAGMDAVPMARLPF